MLFTPTRTLYLMLTLHAMRAATYKDRFNLPRDADAICEYLNTHVTSGYFAPRKRDFVFNAVHPPLRAFLLQDMLRKDTFWAASLTPREGISEHLIEDGPYVAVRWNYEKVPRGFVGSVPKSELTTVEQL